MKLSDKTKIALGVLLMLACVFATNGVAFCALWYIPKIPSFAGTDLAFGFLLLIVVGIIFGGLIGTKQLIRKLFN